MIYNRFAFEYEMIAFKLIIYYYLLYNLVRAFSYSRAACPQRTATYRNDCWEFGTDPGEPAVLRDPTVCIIFGRYYYLPCYRGENDERGRRRTGFLSIFNIFFLLALF